MCACARQMKSWERLKATLTYSNCVYKRLKCLRVYAHVCVLVCILCVCVCWQMFWHILRQKSRKCMGEKKEVCVAACACNSFNRYMCVCFTKTRCLIGWVFDGFDKTTPSVTARGNANNKTHTPTLVWGHLWGQVTEILHQLDNLNLILTLKPSLNPRNSQCPAVWSSQTIEKPTTHACTSTHAPFPLSLFLYQAICYWSISVLSLGVSLSSSLFSATANSCYSSTRALWEEAGLDEWVSKATVCFPCLAYWQSILVSLNNLNHALTLKN